MDLISIPALTGTFIDVIRATPQLARLIRERKSFGVSVDATSTGCIVSLGWTAYGIITGQPYFTLASGIMAGFLFAITLFALRFGRSSREFRIAPFWFMALFGVTLFSGKAGLGLLLSIGALISNIPQIRVAYKEENLSGLSLTTWLLTLSSGLLWGLYAGLQHDPTIITSAFLQSLTSVIIIALKIFKPAVVTTSNQEFITD